MKFIAYILVIALGQFAFTIGTMVCAGLFSMLFYYVPVRIKMPLAMFVAGVMGPVTVFGYGFLIFWLFGFPFTLYPLLATVISMAIPIYNDYKIHRSRMKSAKELYSGPYIPDEARALASGSVADMIVDIHWSRFGHRIFSSLASPA